MDIYLITPPEGEFLKYLSPILEEGIDRLQYRRPNLPDNERLDELRKLSNLLGDYDVPLFVNNRPDLALAISATGVHLGDSDLPVPEVKNKWPHLSVGRTHRVDSAVISLADYISVGPVFDTFTKSIPRDPAGWSGVESVLNKTENPVYAIGGLTPEKVQDVPENLAGVAVVSSVWNADDPAKAVRQYRKVLKK